MKRTHHSPPSISAEWPALPVLFSLALWFAPAGVAGESTSDWPQWGGVGRDFHAASTELASSWPASGPRVLWRRDLGEGNSAIAAVGDRLYTMYRDDDREVVVALDRETGETAWEVGWETPLWEGFYGEYGPGPHTTPLVADGRLYATGIAGRLVCLDAATGREFWHRELWAGVDLSTKEFGPAQLGYSASPLLHDGRLVVLGGDAARGVMALDPQSGDVLWTTEGLEPAFASPIAIRVGDREQIVAFVAHEVAGLDPQTGAILWRAPHETSYLVNAMTPVWDGRDTLFLSSAYDSGSRALRLSVAGGKPTVSEIWSSKRIEVHHQSAVLLGGRVYASSGDFGPAFLVVFEPDSGEVVAQERGFAKANLLAAGERIVVLDEDGVLALATPTDDGLRIDARADVFSTRSWAVPTLTGTTLYARDRKEIVAFDLAGS